ncbi:MAG: type II secretion system F family protein [Candidatus Moranbacteria bacterium]|nr:type II secretion system F family protein [Candidatus Moranbacteria bacterium]
MKYKFKAKDREGNVREGTIEAIDRAVAVQVLQKNNLIPITVNQEQVRNLKVVEDLQRAWEGASPKDIVMFFRSLAVLVEARVPILQALDAVEQQTENKFLRSVIRGVTNDVEDGMAFSDSIAKNPTVFSPLTSSVLKAGEVSGSLHKSIMFVAESLEKNYILTSRVKNALIYPLFILGVAAIVGFIVITIVLPNLTKVIADLAIEVPWYTQVLIWIGDFMEAYWWAVLIVIMGGIGASAYYMNTPDGKKEMDRVLIKMPLFGRLARYVYFARFAENFSMLINGGIPMVKALNVVGDVINNDVYKKIMEHCAREVKAGGNISDVLQKYPDEIEPLLTKMTKIGEETGKIGEVLTKLAGYYEQETENMTKNITTLIEPVMIVVLGLGVGVMVFAVLMPIYNIVSQF